MMTFPLTRWDCCDGSIYYFSQNTDWNVSAVRGLWYWEEILSGVISYTEWECSFWLWAWVRILHLTVVWVSIVRHRHWYRILIWEPPNHWADWLVVVVVWEQWTHILPEWHLKTFTVSWPPHLSPVVQWASQDPSITSSVNIQSIPRIIPTWMREVFTLKSFIPRLWNFQTFQ